MAQANGGRVDGIEFVKMFFTPQLADKWLSESDGNRPLSPLSIGVMCRALEEARARGRDDGLYSPNPVVKNSRGRTIDGHHRLTAIKRAGVGSWLNVQLGYDDVRRIDMGQTRTIAAQAYFTGDSVKRMRRAAEMYNALCRVRRMTKEKTLYADVERFIANGGDSLEWALGLSRVHFPAIAAVAGMIAHSVAPAKTAELFSEAIAASPRTSHAGALAQVLMDAKRAARGGGSCGAFDAPFTRILSVAKRWADGEPCVLARNWPGAIAEFNARRADIGQPSLDEVIANARGIAGG